MPIVNCKWRIAWYGSPHRFDVRSVLRVEENIVFFYMLSLRLEVFPKSPTLSFGLSGTVSQIHLSHWCRVAVIGLEQPWFMPCRHAGLGGKEELGCSWGGAQLSCRAFILRAMGSYCRALCKGAT